MRISYKKKYKYQLAEPYSIDINIRPSKPISLDFIALNCEGVLTLSKGYAWDGASGTAFDTRNFMRASLVHDALYELMRHDVLDRRH